MDRSKIFEFGNLSTVNDLNGKNGAEVRNPYGQAEEIT